MWRSTGKLTDTIFARLGILSDENVRKTVPVGVPAGDFSSSLFASVTSWSIRASRISSSESHRGTSRMTPLYVVYFGRLHWIWRPAAEVRPRKRAFCASDIG